MEKVYKYLLNLLNDETIVVACSGGPDSMALLSLLIKVKDNKPINIICAHVNHKVRTESDDEKLFVENYCKNNNVIFEYYEINDYTDDNFENEARNKRYNFFESCINKYNAKYLFTAHHGDDLMETILMRIVRGSSLKGYSGFKKIVDKNNYKIVRPLIEVTKEEIELYNKDNNIEYVIDKTNYMDIHTRNRYRMNILPLLKNEDKDVHKKFLKFSNTLQEYNDYFDNIIKDKIDNIYKDNTIYLDELNKLDEILKKRVINYIFEDLYLDDLMLISDIHTDLVLSLINSNHPNGIVRLPEGILVERNYDKLSFIKEEYKKEDYEIELTGDIILPNGYKIIFVDSEESDSNYVCRLKYTDIKLPLYVRNRQNSDRMYIKNLNGSKKINEIFINSKLSTKERDNQPIVLDSNNNIVWLPGIKKSKYDKEKNEKYDIILKYVKEEK